MKLHNQILLALVLGAVFGAIFHVDKNSLNIAYVDPTSAKITEQIQQWQKVEFMDGKTGETLGTFGTDDQLKILSAFSKLSGEGKKNLIIRATFAAASPREFKNVKSVDKVKSVALVIKPIGTIFIRLLMMVAIPLVFASLVVGVASLGDLRKVGRIGAKTIGLYLGTTAMAITIGLTLVNAMQPGTRLDAESRERLTVEFQGQVQEKIQAEVAVDVVDMFVRMVATNPIQAMSNGDMLAIIFFALMVGISLTMISREKSSPVIAFFDGISDMMIKMVELIMKIAPYGVFALIAATVGEFGFGILQTLAWYAAAVVIGLMLHTFGTLAVLIRFVSKLKPVTVFKKLRPVMLIAFSSSSSAATLPVNMEVCEKELGVSKEVTSFVLPLGATINMDGTSMYQAIAAVFIAQVYGVPLDLSGQLTILLTALLASIGTAPVPGVGLIMLIIVLRSVGIPEEGIVLILGIDRILDMCRTVTNVTGDAVVATIIQRGENNFLAKKDLQAA